MLSLEQAGKVKEALAGARRLKADVPSLFEDPEKTAVLDRLLPPAEPEDEDEPENASQDGPGEAP